MIERLRPNLTFIAVFPKLGVATHLCVAQIRLCVAKNTTVSYLSRKS